MSQRVWYITIVAWTSDLDLPLQVSREPYYRKFTRLCPGLLQRIMTSRTIPSFPFGLPLLALCVTRHLIVTLDRPAVKVPHSGEPALLYVGILEGSNVAVDGVVKILRPGPDLVFDKVVDTMELQGGTFTIRDMLKRKRLKWGAMGADCDRDKRREDGVGMNCGSASQTRFPSEIASPKRGLS